MTRRQRDTPRASDATVRKRMRATRRRDTPPELNLRRCLHRMGYRYKVDFPPIGGSRRRADLVFRREMVAVFVDGCFWHGCPRHGTSPKSNADWWKEKLSANRRRDEDTNTMLREAGWTVVRVWEHEDAGRAAQRIAKILGERRRALQ